MQKKELVITGVLLVGVLLVVGIYVKNNIQFQTGTSQDTKMVLYSPHCGDDNKAQFIKNRARDEVGLDVECMGGGGGALADRLNNEKNDPQADVVMALNQVFMYQFKDNEVITSYVPKWSDEIPSKYRDPEGYFYGLGRTPILIAYNRQFIKDADAPKGWTDLVDDKFKGQYSLAPIENQTTRVYLASMLWRFYDPASSAVSSEGWDFMKKLYANSYAYANVSYDDVKSGSTPILIDWYGNIKNQSQNYGIDIAYVEDPTGSPIVAESIALINNGKHQDNGKKFIEWFGLAEVQAAYAQEFFQVGQIPINTRAATLSSEEIKSASTMFNDQGVDYDTVSAHLKDWLTKIELEIK